MNTSIISRAAGRICLPSGRRPLSVETRHIVAGHPVIKQSRSGLDLFVKREADGTDTLTIDDRSNGRFLALRGLKKGDLMLCPVQTKNKKGLVWLLATAVNLGHGDRKHAAMYAGNGKVLDIWKNINTPRSKRGPVVPRMLVDFLGVRIDNGINPEFTTVIRMTESRSSIEGTIDYLKRVNRIRQCEFSVQSNPHLVKTFKGKKYYTGFNCAQLETLAWIQGGGLKITEDKSWDAVILYDLFGFLYGNNRGFRFSGESLYAAKIKEFKWEISS